MLGALTFKQPTKVEVCFVLGLLWAEVKQLYSLGLEEYGNDMWNLLDFVTNALYLSTITLRAIAYYKVTLLMQTLYPVVAKRCKPFILYFNYDQAG